MDRTPVPARTASPRRPELHDDLCGWVFRSLTRSDQRRWAHVYVHGLLSLSGRRSLRRIAAAHGPDTTEQALQQFVNQSPWDWGAVRRSLATAIETSAPRRAWVVQEIEFPKNGRHSAGVAMQYAPGARRAMNCQLGLAVWDADPAGAVPVDWRLMLPPCWDDEPDRRGKAHLPDTAHSRSVEEHVLEVVDEMVGRWGLTQRPVVVDRRHGRYLDLLLRGLEERGMTYAIRIDPHRAARQLPRGSVSVIAGAAGDRTPLRIDPEASGRTRRLVGFRARRSARRQCWLTNLGRGAGSELTDLVGASSRVDDELRDLRDDTGLAHFEGRSYQGWHHHVTLASIAHAHRQSASECLPVA